MLPEGHQYFLMPHIIPVELLESSGIHRNDVEILVIPQDSAGFHRNETGIQRNALIILVDSGEILWNYQNIIYSGEIEWL